MIYTVGPRFSDILGGKVFLSLNRDVTKSGSNAINFLYRVRLQLYNVHIKLNRSSRLSKKRSVSAGNSRFNDRKTFPPRVSLNRGLTVIRTKSEYTIIIHIHINFFFLSKNKLFICKLSEKRSASAGNRTRAF